jgi:hypothetical protein
MIRRGETKIITKFRDEEKGRRRRYNPSFADGTVYKKK